MIQKNKIYFTLTAISITLLFIFYFSGCYFITNTRKLISKPIPLKDINSSKYEAYWVGHATVLIKMDNKWILTDPIWNDNLLYTLGRYVEPGIELDHLPPLDYILISHVHLDHLDTYTLKRLSKKAHLVLPLGAPDFSSYGFRKISYVKKNDILFDDYIKIHIVTAQHFGGRWAIDNIWDGSPYNGYIITDKYTSVYFAGDTGYNPKDFIEIGKNFKIDLALIPVGPYRGKLFGNDLGNPVHVSPTGAIQIFKDINAKKMVPIHHGTFYSNPNIEIEYVKSAIQQSGLKDRIFLLEQGMKLQFDPQ